MILEPGCAEICDSDLSHSKIPMTQTLFLTLTRVYTSGEATLGCSLVESELSLTG